MAGASPALSAESPVLDVRSCTWLNRGLPETVFPEDRVELKSQDADCYLCWMSQVAVQAQRLQVQPVICRFFDDTLVERLLAARSFDGQPGKPRPRSSQLEVVGSCPPGRVYSFWGGFRR